MGPLRTGFIYGIIAVLVALLSEFYFLFVDPAGTPGWVLAVIQQYHTRLAFAAFLFLGILAALRVRPVHIDPGVPYRSLLLRDGALAATVVAVMVGATLFLVILLQSTVFADGMRSYAREASPQIVSYVNGLRESIRERRIERGASREKIRDLPPPAKVQDVRETLRPPGLQDLGRSIANTVLRAVLMGTLGALVGVLRGRSYSGQGSGRGSRETGKPPDR